MTKPTSALYQIQHSSLEKLLRADIDRAIHGSPSNCHVFFRADDIGIPSKNFQNLIQCFQKHKMPLCLATVPSWLTEKRLDELYSLTGKNSFQWCWHQHGVTHRNFEFTGKKQEFGPTRSKEQQRLSLKQGRERLTNLLGKDFFPVFTPPWNRCTGDTLQTLVDLNFLAISRSRGATPECSSVLPDFAVNVDLHTRKEVTAALALNNLQEELVLGISSGFCGIMIHHQRMNKLAFEFLDLLLHLIRMDKKLTPVHFNDLLV